MEPGTTEEKIARSLKKLVLKKPFEKITVKEITDGAGVIRPTFYNHFSDKYEVIEWIYMHEVIEPGRALVETGMAQEYVRFVLARMKNDKEFYLAASKIQGQNSFENIITNLFQNMFCHYFVIWMNTVTIDTKWLTPVRISKFYANETVFLIKEWIDDNMSESSEEIAKIFSIAGTESFTNILKLL